MRIGALLMLLTVFLISGCSEVDVPVNQDGTIVILMYHKIVRGEARTLYERSSAEFEKDLEYLRTNNIEVIGFEELKKYIASRSVPQGKHALLTFDDGDESWFDIVTPALASRGYRATFFLWVSEIGKTSFITWDKVKLMSMYRYPDGTNPFVFGSHTFSHPYLEQNRNSFQSESAYNSFLDYELGESKRKIESETGQIVNLLALPFGDGAGNEQIITAAKRNGYEFIRTSLISTVNPYEPDLYKLPGIAILNTTSINDLEEYFISR